MVDDLQRPSNKKSRFLELVEIPEKLHYRVTISWAGKVCNYHWKHFQGSAQESAELDRDLRNEADCWTALLKLLARFAVSKHSWFGCVVSCLRCVRYTPSVLSPNCLPLSSLKIIQIIELKGSFDDLSNPDLLAC